MANPASVWTPKTLVQFSANLVTASQSFIAEAAQVLFTLTEFSYVPNTGSIRVFLNNIETFSFVQTDATNITLVTAPGAGVIVKIIGTILGPVDSLDIRYLPTGTAASLSANPSVLAGFVIQTTHFSADKVIDSGAQYQFTGTTTIGKAGTWPNADGHFYDSDGKQFSVTIVNPRAFGAVGDTSISFSGAAANTGQGTDDTSAFEAALLEAAGGTLYVPDGSYTISRPLTIPDYTAIVCSPRAIWHYFDTASPGSYLLNISATPGVNGGGVTIDNLFVYLRSGTASGMLIRNARSCLFTNTYIEGWIPPAPYTGISSRTNEGVRIEPDGGIAWFNTFRGLHVNHVHSGVYALKGINSGISTQMAFYDVRLFGDVLYGDTASDGFVITGCQDSYVYGGYIEAYPTSAHAGVNILGPSAVRWMFRDVVFDYAPTFTMTAIRIANSSGFPSSNNFENCLIAGSVNGRTTSICIIDDASTAVSYNNVHGYGPKTYTATLTATTGTATLTSGIGGDLCNYELKGNMVRVWGTIEVASVGGGLTGVATISLPLTIRNSNNNVAVGGIIASGLESTATMPAFGYGTRSTANLDIYKFVAGTYAAQAVDIKAATSIIFNIEYQIE